MPRGRPKKTQTLEPKTERKKREPKPVDPQQELIDKSPKITVQAKCMECEHRRAWATTVYHSFGHHLLIGLKGNKCSKCGRFGSFKATVKCGQFIVQKAVVSHHDMDSEEFVDNDLNIVPNPIPPDYILGLEKAELSEKELQK